MSAVLRAEVVRDAERFAALEAEWWELWRRVAAATPFQSPAWLIPWWRCFHPGELFVVTVRAAGRLVGLAPFYVEEGTRRLLPLGISVSDHLDVLVAPGCEALAGQALVTEAERAGDIWDEWSLEELAPDALGWGLPTPAGCEDVSAAQSVCPVLDFPIGADNIWRFVPTRQRRDTNLARNRAARQGEVRIEPMEAADAPGFLDTLSACMGRVGKAAARPACWRMTECKISSGPPCRVLPPPASRAASCCASPGLRRRPITASPTGSAPVLI